MKKPKFETKRSATQSLRELIDFLRPIRHNTGKFITLQVPRTLSGFRTRMQPRISATHIAIY